MANLFDLTSQDIRSISVFLSFSGQSCFIAENENKSNIYDGFILRKGERASTICNITFHPSSISKKFIPRLEFKIRHTKNEVDKITERDVRISFATIEEGYEQFWEMIGFLSGFKDLVDTGDFKGVYRVVDASQYVVAFKSKGEAEQVKELSSLITESGLTETTIRKALADTRESALGIFNGLLNDSSALKTYRTKNAIKKLGDEAIWHHFLKTNSWILGLTVDVRFIRDLISELDTGIKDTAGQGAPKTDMLGLHDYTVLVELKTPNTRFFTPDKKGTARAGTWSFTDDFIDGVSQCLSQRTEWEQTHRVKKLKDPTTNEIVDQNLTRTADPKAIFVIGNKIHEIPQTSTNNDILIKRDTLELFRRNSRNIDIITYDELYERAHCIVHGVRPKTA